MKIILASSSSYRKSLLERLGLVFEVANPQLDEKPELHETALDLVSRLSRQKAEKIGIAQRSALVIGSDQVACLADQMLNKPGNRENAILQLQMMCGKTVNFLTGICVYNAATRMCQTAVVPYEVSFRDFSVDEIHRYLDLDTPYDCAGSFKSEQLGISLVREMRGADPTALMGLPLIKLSELLRREGLKIP